MSILIIIGAILDEIGLHQLSNQIPQAINIKSIGINAFGISRDPTLVAPRNSIQADNFEYLNMNANERLLHEEDHCDKHSQPQASRNIYQALKRGLRRLSSIRRNNSA